MAYSYLRFSSPDQQYGDSLRRQTALAVDYAFEFDLILDDQLTYQDFGISGFRGQNVASGRLGDFLAAISAGLVPTGSVLLVENLDRLSRDSALNAQNLLTQIVLAGVSVVTLSDRRTYSVEELRRDPMGLIFALINFIRANEESAIKSSRAKANWVAKRATALTKPLTSKCPAWLSLDRTTDRFVKLTQRVAVVKTIFDLADQGKSFTEIARILTRRKTPTWTGRGLWDRHTVGNIITFSAVVGTYVPHHNDYVNGKIIRRPLKPIPGYYPAIISVEQFDRVHRTRLANYTSGRSVIGYLLQHLAVCNTCGHFLSIVRRAEHGPSMACAAAIAGTRGHYTEVPYLPIDKALRGSLLKILQSFHLPEEYGSSNRLRMAQNGVDRTRRDRFDDAFSASNGDPNELVLHAFRAAEDEMLEAVESYDSRATQPLRRTIGIALECLADPDFGPVEARLINRALKAIFTRAVIDAPKRVINLHQQDGDIQSVAY
ncbi:recombinase family protein [Sphingomonas sp. GB1N7]|uniref:recombinase family protein n=1 Tax=Parasphingomonas caseinilytica TaxID=3096158 RepID=UPI002FCA833C